MQIRYWDVPDASVRSIGLWINGIGRTASSERINATINRNQRSHIDHLLLFIASGEHYLVHGHETITLRANEGVLVRPNISFRSYPNIEGPWENFWVHFEGPVADALSGLLASPSDTWYIRFEGAKKDIQAYEQILEEFHEKSPWYHAASSSLLHQRFTSMLRSRALQLSEQTAAPDSQLGRLLRRCVHYMQEHFREDIRVQEIADQLGYNRSHFSRLFTQYIGSSPQDYIVRLRMAEAKRLLLSTDETIGAIAISLHYRNPDSFTKQFKKVVGISPQQFRMNQA